MHKPYLYTYSMYKSLQVPDLCTANVTIYIAGMGKSILFEPVCSFKQIFEVALKKSEPVFVSILYFKSIYVFFPTYWRSHWSTSSSRSNKSSWSLKYNTNKIKVNQVWSKSMLIWCCSLKMLSKPVLYFSQVNIQHFFFFFYKFLFYVLPYTFFHLFVCSYIFCWGVLFANFSF